MNDFNSKFWVAFVGIAIIEDIPERGRLFVKHENPSHFVKKGLYDINLFTCSLFDHVNPIDVTGTNAEGEPEYTTEDLINLLMTHNTEQGVLMTSGQATAVYNVLKPEVIEQGMV